MNPACKGKLSFDLISCHRAYAFGGRVRILEHNLVASLRNPGSAPERVASEESHQVEQVDPEHD